MMTVWLDNSLQALQLKETLLEAGFAAGEISVTSPSSVGLVSNDTDAQMTLIKTRRPASFSLKYRLTVQTQTGLDEDLAKAVFRDCGISKEKIEARPFQGSFGIAPRKPEEKTIKS